VNGMQATVHGSGVVIAQEPEPGTDSTLVVDLTCALPPAQFDEDKGARNGVQMASARPASADRASATPASGRKTGKRH
jgi:hypothetical protein